MSSAWHSLTTTVTYISVVDILILYFVRNVFNFTQSCTLAVDVMLSCKLLCCTSCNVCCGVCVVQCGSAAVGVSGACHPKADPGFGAG